MDIGWNANPSAPLPGVGATFRAPVWCWDAAPGRWEDAGTAGWKRVLLIDERSALAADPSCNWQTGPFDVALVAIQGRYPDAEIVEFSNEPDSSGQSASPQPAAAYASGIRSTVSIWPEAEVWAGGLAGIDFTYLGPAAQAGAQKQALHTYAQTAESLPGLLAICRENTTLPFVVSEFGEQKALETSEHDRAGWFSNILIAMWEQGVEAALVYRYDMDPAATDPAVDFSVLDANGNPLESYAAIASAIPNLAGSPPPPTETTPPAGEVPGLKPVLDVNGTDISVAVANAANAAGVKPTVLLALCKAESGLNPVAERWGDQTTLAQGAILAGDVGRLQRIVDAVWPDISFGYGQQTVLYSPLGDQQATAQNCLMVRTLMFAIPARAFGIAAQALKSCYGNSTCDGTDLSALAIYNAGSDERGNPAWMEQYGQDIANYASALEWAAAYAA